MRIPGFITRKHAIIPFVLVLVLNLLWGCQSPLSLLRNGATNSGGPGGELIKPSIQDPNNGEHAKESGASATVPSLEAPTATHTPEPKSLVKNGAGLEKPVLAPEPPPPEPKKPEPRPDPTTSPKPETPAPVAAPTSLAAGEKPGSVAAAASQPDPVKHQPEPGATGPEVEPFKKHDYGKYVDGIRSKAVDKVNREFQCVHANLCKDRNTDLWELTLYYVTGKTYWFVAYAWDEVDQNWGQALESEKEPLTGWDHHHTFASAGKECQVLKRFRR